MRGVQAIAQRFMRPKPTRNPFYIRGEANGIIGMGRTVKPHGGKGTNKSLLPLCAITLDLPQQPRQSLQSPLSPQSTSLMQAKAHMALMQG